MNVKEVVALAAANLGREELAAAARDLAARPSGELLTLLRCYNLVENEVALDYFPLETEERFDPAENAVGYVRFSLAPVHILSVKNAAGREIGFELLADRIALPAGTGSVTVRYTYSPAEKKWEDDSEFGGRISARLLSFGVASEFCLSGGMYEAAAMWEKRFREALRAANLSRRRLAVRSRRWV